jgi:hypothetical protein
MMHGVNMKIVIASVCHRIPENSKLKSLGRAMT